MIAVGEELLFFTQGYLRLFFFLRKIAREWLTLDGLLVADFARDSTRRRFVCVFFSLAVFVRTNGWEREHLWRL